MAQKSGRGDYNAISDINVTPFVDVVLVLLVIFMVTAPTIMKDNLGIQLPKSSVADGPKMKTLGLAITRQGQFLINGELVDDASFDQKVKDLLKADPTAQALISADQDSRHVDLVRGIELLKKAGLEKFALEIHKEEVPGAGKEE